MRSNGREALARLMERTTGSDEPVSDEIWADFKAAVADATAELQEEEAAGVRRWQEARHDSGDR